MLYMWRKLKKDSKEIMQELKINSDEGPNIMTLSLQLNIESKKGKTPAKLTLGRRRLMRFQNRSHNTVMALLFQNTCFEFGITILNFS